ncbi:hypothetical protein V8G54_034455 [Vigna mungo]|uniref:Reverse transcriptase/retrotransposon-derived protein RNase H-like domain-containing protein n=1 Tax=Vigna mungo TaxID=3915 RepID=A0AAQ3RJR1_VIGMU
MHEEQLFSYFTQGLKDDIHARMRRLHVENPLSRGRMMNVARAIDVEISGRSRMWQERGEPRGKGKTQVENRPLAQNKMRAIGEEMDQAQDLLDRKQKGLCYKCGGLFGPLYRCPVKQFRGEKEIDNDEEEYEVAAPCTALNICTITSDNDDQPRTMKLRGMIGEIPMLFLIDSGATHNFISRRIVEALGSRWERTKQKRVLMGDRHKSETQGVCKGIKVRFDEGEFEIDVFLFDFEDMDMILGMLWLITLGETTVDWKKQIMKVQTNQGERLLRGIPHGNSLIMSVCGLLEDTSAERALDVSYFGLLTSPPEPTSLHVTLMGHRFFAGPFRSPLKKNTVRIRCILTVYFFIGGHNGHRQQPKFVLGEKAKTIKVLVRKPLTSRGRKRMTIHIPSRIIYVGAEKSDYSPNWHTYRRQGRGPRRTDVYKAERNDFSSNCQKYRRQDDGRNPKRRSVLDNMFQHFSEVFEEPKGLPLVRVKEHRVNLKPGQQPINKNEIEKQVLELMEVGYLRHNQSAYSNPIILVKKKNNKWRMCVDYRALNKATILDKFPIPVIEELLDELHGAWFFFKLDICSGYHQVRMGEQDIPKTAFRTHEECEGVRGFLGLTSYYRKFIKDYGKVVKPLTELTKKDGFGWNGKAQEAFEELKRRITIALVLQLPNFDEEFVLECDASGTGIEAILM